MKKYILHVNGTHCASCKILIEDILNNEELVERAEVNLNKELLEVEINQDIGIEKITDILSEKIEKNGYSLSVEKMDLEKNNSLMTWKAVFIGIGVLVLFFLLQKSKILNLGIGGETTPVTSFIIGIVASLSSCLAIVGGLILSLSAKISQDDNKNKKPFIFFHGGGDCLDSRFWVECLV